MNEILYRCTKCFKEPRFEQHGVSLGVECSCGNGMDIYAPTDFPGYDSLKRELAKMWNSAQKERECSYREPTT